MEEAKVNLCLRTLIALIVFVLGRGWIRAWLGMTLLRRMMYDFKKWQYNSAEKQAVIEEAMKVTRNFMLPMRSSYFRFLVLWLNKGLRKLPVDKYVHVCLQVCIMQDARTAFQLLTVY